MKGLDVLAPKIIKQATVQVDQIVQRRIQQIINQGGHVENVAPKKLADAKNGCVYLGNGSPIGVLISAATSLLGLPLFKKIF